MPLPTSPSWTPRGRGPVLYIAGNILDTVNPTVDGLRIVGGDAAGLGGSSDRDVDGGIYIYRSAATLRSLGISDNTAGAGGGIYLYNSPATLRSSVLLGMGKTVLFTNTIVVSHTTAIYAGLDTAVSLASTLWGDNAWANVVEIAGSGSVVSDTVSLHGDPAFVDPDNGDYHIGQGSAAIDRRTDAGVTTDMDGDTRPQGTAPDLGADEYVHEPGTERRIYLPCVER
jgi:hypothetical protein